MNNLTNEERARIFAMYYGAEVQTCFKETYVVNGNIIQDIASVWPMHNDAKLLLTPCLKITDEHAIEVAKICKPNVVWNITKKEPFNRIVLESNSYRLSIWFVDYYCIEFEYCDTPSHFSSISDVIDRLRELGYALPYKGQSLFDLGIAIDKTTLNS